MKIAITKFLTELGATTQDIACKNFFLRAKKENKEMRDGYARLVDAIAVEPDDRRRAALESLRKTAHNLIDEHNDFLIVATRTLKPHLAEKIEEKKASGK